MIREKYLLCPFCGENVEGTLGPEALKDHPGFVHNDAKSGEYGYQCVACKAFVPVPIEASTEEEARRIQADLKSPESVHGPDIA